MLLRLSLSRNICCAVLRVGLRPFGFLYSIVRYRSSICSIADGNWKQLMCSSERKEAHDLTIIAWRNEALLKKKRRESSVG